MMEASPRALAVAPFAYTTVISSYAKKGILLKGGQVLDALASCHTNAFDKSGRLTTGGRIFKAIEPTLGHQVGKELTTHAASCCIPSCEGSSCSCNCYGEEHSTSYWKKTGNENGSEQGLRKLSVHLLTGMTLSMLLFPLMKSMVGEAINDAAATVGIVLAQHASATAIAVADVLYCQVSPNKFPGQTECGAGFDFHNSGFHSIFLFNRSGNQHIRCRWLPIVTELSGLRWFFNTEVGALLKCQNSVRALNDPKWSWKEDMQLAQLPLDDECCQAEERKKMYSWQINFSFASLQIDGVTEIEQGGEREKEACVLCNCQFACLLLWRCGARRPPHHGKKSCSSSKLASFSVFHLSLIIHKVSRSFSQLKLPNHLPNQP